jgi:hypothetical protein
MLWLTNPSHQKFGTIKSRRLAKRQSLNLLFDALSAVGFLKGARCIHGKEGKWNDPDSPFYGGMQMDLEFQQTYGKAFYARWGTADKWPRWSQLYAAYLGWKERFWYPWPNTARDCGLI